MPSNIERKAHRKKQTRLSFDPLDRSSSPANIMSPAKVRYQMPTTSQTAASSARTLAGDTESDDVLSFGKKMSRATPVDSKKNGSLPFKPLPTPAKSSQTQIDAGLFNNLDELQDESGANKHESPRILRSSSRIISSGRSQRKQRSVGFDAAGDSSEGSPPEEETYTPSKNESGKGKGKADKVLAISLASDSEEVEMLHKSGKTRSQKATAILPNMATRGSSNKQQRYVKLSSDSSSDAVDLPPPKSTQKAKSLFTSSKRVHSGPQKSRAKVSSSRQRSRKAIFSDDSDDDEIITTSQPKPQQRSIVKQDDDNESEDLISSPPKRKRQPHTEELDTDSEDPISSPLKRRRPTVGLDDPNIVSSSLKRRRDREAEDSSEDDLPFPSKIPHCSRSASKSPSRHTRQSKIRRHRTEKEKTLELLRRKRAGENIDALTESESEFEEDSGPELQELSEFEDESEAEVVEKPRKPARRKENEDGYDSDFVDDDEDGNLGIPNHALLDVPLEFTHAAHKPLKEHFKDAVEWMVHNKINPAFARDDPLYFQAFKKLDDEYGGYAKSKFVSSQWTADFTRAIYARPRLLERELAAGEGIDITGEGKCDVCNHRKHYPRYEIQFEGKAYHKDSLEEVEQDSDDSSDEDNDISSSNSDEQSVNADGQRIPRETTKWFSGRFCKANATQAHSLIHWKYALNIWVIGNLEAEGYLTPEKLAEREKMKGKQRRAYANEVVDKWGSDGHIKDLYRDFKINLEAAREAKQTRWSAGNFM